MRQGIDGHGGSIRTRSCSQLGNVDALRPLGRASRVNDSQPTRSRSRIAARSSSPHGDASRAPVGRRASTPMVWGRSRSRTPGDRGRAAAEIDISPHQSGELGDDPTIAKDERQQRFARRIGVQPPP